jgi:hypothetical protein
VSRKTARKPNHSGSTLDSLLREDGILEEVEAIAIKRVIAWQLAQIMKTRKILRTSRSQLDRLLDPDNASVQLATITRAAKVVGKKIRLELVDGA